MNNKSKTLKETSPKRKWPGLEEIVTYASGVPDVDDRKVFNSYLKAALIVGDLTPEEYILLETTLDGIRRLRDEKDLISDRARSYLYETITDEL